ncbi:MAG: hypothetical protein GX343_03470 [Erysipelotrichaceae bacterium]|jgi:phosphoglycerol transferase MdoB-like AlkP superfamily enzyme|nr:hypothetical protein [Bacillota bacterium]MDY0118277.1 hypothetical protein [Bacilli bacterium]NLJ32878.1 hypothetical protein [Erysipelotrichaceae bacterium]HOF65043.1 hypothetical protein [Bacilli bacterium]
MKKQEKETKHEVNEGYGGVDPYDYPDILKIILSIILPPLALVYIFAFAKNKPFARKWYVIAMVVGSALYLLIIAFILVNQKPIPTELSL